MDYSIKLEVFKRIVLKLKEQGESMDKAYKAGIDLISFTGPYESVISMLIGSIYGQEGKETFDWWCYEKNFGERTDLTMTDKDGNELCRTIEELHQYLEDNKVNDYYLSKYQIMTDEERTALLNQLISDYEQP
jgi:hypothetical protein